jgi:diguanylate cyclase (GGDEF)-like protein
LALPIRVQPAWYQTAAFKSCLAAAGLVAVFALERGRRQLAELALTDSLTGLRNRAALTQWLAKALHMPEPLTGPFAVLFLDLDKFKEVNDVMGHDVGDAVLREVAERFSAIVTADSISARWGGDEFVFVLPNAGRARAAIELATHLRRKVSEPIGIGAATVRIDATIGIALFPDHGRTPDELIRAADVAMYAGKKDGHGQVRVFDPSLADELRNRHVLQQALRDAIVDNALYLEYQPIVAAKSGSCEALEALIRWKHPIYGFIPPSDFIPVAERSGDIVSIGRWVLAQACAAAMTWPGAPAPAVSVNVSVAQILAGTLIDDVCAALSSSQLIPDRLHIEVTESLFASDEDVVVPTLDALRAMGIRILLDDFGTGFSSFGSVRTLPIDVIKIDKSFVDTMHGESEPIIEAILSLARALGRETVAEGVETAHQAAVLAAMGVNALQGYYFSRPLPAPAVSAWLTEAGSLDLARAANDLLSISPNITTPFDRQASGAAA